jgi:hypothetical protein
MNKQGAPHTRAFLPWLQASKFRTRFTSYKMTSFA